MPDDVYEVVAQAARYWFLFIMALIVWRSFRWLRKDAKKRKKRLKLLPDAGYVGELVVIEGSAELPAGLALPVSSEGILGSVRSDDLFVPVKGVAKKHLWYEFDENDGLAIHPFGRMTVEADGETITGRRAHAALAHGSTLKVGDAELRLRLFAGFESAGVRYAAYAREDMPPAAEVQQTPEQPAQATQPTAVQGVTFTPEQVEVLQQMQWVAAMQAMQAMQQPAAQPEVINTQQGAFAPPPKIEKTGAILPGDEEPETWNEPEAYADTADDWQEPPRASARLRRAPLPPLAAAQPDEERADARMNEEPDTYDEDGFYPPLEGDEPDFAPAVSVYPPEDAYEDDSEPDADPDHAPDDLYVEPDEAAEAKRLLWDKYLKGDRRHEP